jgi:hypothetical protein
MSEKKEMKRKGYEFHQNNSGGHFFGGIYGVVVEADTEEEACDLFSRYSGFDFCEGGWGEDDEEYGSSCGCCPCCGHRWIVYGMEVDIEDPKTFQTRWGIFAEAPDKLIILKDGTTERRKIEKVDHDQS